MIARLVFLFAVGLAITGNGPGALAALVIAMVISVPWLSLWLERSGW